MDSAAHALSQNPSEIGPIVVGARKESCEDPQPLLMILKCDLKHELGRAAYSEWVKAREDGQCVTIQLQFVTVENSRALTDPAGSSLREARMAVTENPVIDDDRPVIFRCWDLGGQHEYEMAHSLFVRFMPIILFTIDLTNLEDPLKAEGEILELCRWIQLAQALADNRSEVVPIIVGTRKADCSKLDSQFNEFIRKQLCRELGKAAYDDWVKDDDRDESMYGRLRFVAIDNKFAQDSRASSGLQDLERLLERAAEEIIVKRSEILARWIAFIDRLEAVSTSIGLVLITKQDVAEVLNGFPGFDANIARREDDGLAALKFFRQLGRLAFFEVSQDGYYVLWTLLEL